MKYLKINEFFYRKKSFHLNSLTNDYLYLSIKNIHTHINSVKYKENPIIICYCEQDSREVGIEIAGRENVDCFLKQLESSNDIIDVTLDKMKIRGDNDMRIYNLNGEFFAYSSVLEYDENGDISYF